MTIIFIPTLHYDESDRWGWIWKSRDIKISDDKKIESEDYYLMMEDIEQYWWIHCYLRKDSAKYKWVWSWFYD